MTQIDITPIWPELAMAAATILIGVICIIVEIYRTREGTMRYYVKKITEPGRTRCAVMNAAYAKRCGLSHGQTIIDGHRHVHVRGFADIRDAVEFSRQSWGE